MLALCEQCGHSPAHPVCQDPDDPWFLCPWCLDELHDRLQAARTGPTYSLDDVLAELAGSTSSSPGTRDQRVTRHLGWILVLVLLLAAVVFPIVRFWPSHWW